MLDTSSDTEIVVVVRDGHAAASIQTDAVRHSRNLLLTIDRLLQDMSLRAGDLDLVACGTGPGSFTGLRIGVVTARTFAQTLGISAASFPSHELYCCTSGLIAGDRVMVAFDAKKQRVYGTVYEITAEPYVFKTLMATEDCPFEKMKPLIDERTFFAGDYFTKHHNSGNILPLPEKELCARYAEKIGEEITHEKREGRFDRILPRYCRKSDAEVAKDALIAGRPAAV